MSLRRHLVGLTLLALVVAACSGTATDTTTNAPGSSTTITTAPATTVTTVAQTTTTTSTQPPAETTTTQPPAETTTTTTAPPRVQTITIPLGPDTIEYRPGDEDLEALGPSLLAVTDDGAVHFFDPVARRLVTATDTGLESIDLPERDILSVTAMASDGNDLLLVEVFFGPVRQRIHRLDRDGTVIETVDLPPGFRLEDGLSGIFGDSGDDVLLEFAGGGFYARYDASTGDFAMEATPVIRGVSVAPEPPDLVIDGITLTADLTAGLGALRYLGTDPDGNHVVERIDVLETSPVVRVLRTVEWYSPAGELLGSAAVPSIEEQAIDETPGIAVGPAGEAVALLALEDAVVLRVLERQPTRIVG